jgi:hypothetical protein
MIILVPIMLLAGLLAVGLVFMLALRNLTLGEARTEARLRSPDVPTVTYPVPHGQDPAVLKNALTHDGFTSVPEIVDGVERLIIECGEADRAKVRRTIQHANRAGSAGIAMHTDRVRFDDETKTA